MDLVQFLTLLITIAGMFATLVGMFLWNRGESRSDMRHMDNKLDSYRELTRAMVQEIRQETKEVVAEIRRETKEMVTEIRQETQEIRQETKEMKKEFETFRNTMYQETKDFHKRLCSIEEARKTA